MLETPQGSLGPRPDVIPFPLRRRGEDYPPLINEELYIFLNIDPKGVRDEYIGEKKRNTYKKGEKINPSGDARV